MKLTKLFEDVSNPLDLASCLYSVNQLVDLLEDPNYYFGASIDIESYQGGFLAGKDTYKLQQLSRPPVMMGLVFLPLIALAHLTNRKGLLYSATKGVGFSMSIRTAPGNFDPIDIPSFHLMFETLVQKLSKAFQQNLSIEDVLEDDDIQDTMSMMEDELVSLAKDLDLLDLTYKQIWGNGSAAKRTLYIDTIVKFLYTAKKVNQ